MENLAENPKMEKTPLLINGKPYKRLMLPEKRFSLSDHRNSFASVIAISGKKFLEQCILSEDQKSSGQFDVLNVSLSNSEISISSLVKFPSDQFKVHVPTSEPISFGIYHKSLIRALKLMSVRMKHHVLLAYQAQEDVMIIADDVAEVLIKTDGHLYPKSEKLVTPASELKNSSGSSGFKGGLTRCSTSAFESKNLSGSSGFKGGLTRCKSRETPPVLKK